MRTQPVGAKLARDSGGSVGLDVGCAGLFAGKPAPTLDLQWARNVCSAQIPLREQSLLAIAGCWMYWRHRGQALLPHGFRALVGLEITLIRNQSVGQRHFWLLCSVLSGEPACSELDFLERRQAPALSGKEGIGYE